jgi:hypothetical protein
MDLPTISNYGEYSSSNYGAHSLRVDVGPLTIWYSYRTPVAFRLDGHGKVVHRNDWGTTTGKHLNWIDDGNKPGRVSADEFRRQWDAQVAPLLAGVTV